MGAYCSAIWRCRYFWLSLVKMDLRSRYRGSVLGMGWSLLQPIAMTIILCVVFCRMFGEDPATFAPYVLTGLAFWNFILTTTLLGCQCFFQGETYIRQYPAPMAIYPLRTVLACAFHLALALGVAIGLGSFTLGVFSLGALLSLIPTMVLLLAFGWCLAVLAGLATVYFRDTRHLAEVGFQVLFYLTPIFYRATMLESNGLTWLLRWNPLMPFLDLLRSVVERGTVPSLLVYGRATLIVLLAVSLATYTLSRLEKRLIFHL